MAVTQNKPSKFSVNHVLFNPYWLTMIDELYLYSWANEPNKSPWRERLRALLLREIGHLSSPSRSCLGSLFFICGGPGGCVKAPWQEGREEDLKEFPRSTLYSNPKHTISLQLVVRNLSYTLCFTMYSSSDSFIWTLLKVWHFNSLTL